MHEDNDSVYFDAIDESDESDQSEKSGDAIRLTQVIEKSVENI